ncbi:DUF4328 domain-containing protein [Zavarzinia sp.]|uniref:DUF4328 domain-containing protein n=1 Tax=Zavarzinia sp. TaxID=2027920 RepID=UPI0035661662
MASGGAGGSPIYRAMTPRALAVAVLALAAAAISVVALDWLLRVQHGGGDAAVEAAAFWSWLEVGALACVAAALVQLIAGLRGNLPALGVGDAAWPPPTVVLFATLPGLNIVFAGLVMIETWRASDPDRPQSLFVNWRASPGGGAVAIWLVLLIAGLCLLVLPWALLGLGAQGEAQGLLDGPLLISIGHLCLIASQVMLGPLAVLLARRQHLRAGRPDVGALPVW